MNMHDHSSAGQDGASDISDQTLVNREAKRQRTRRELVAIAMALFREKGYEATTIDDIALRGGIARRTFFRYFPTKDDLVLGWLDEQGRAIGAQLAERTGGGLPMEAVQQAFMAFAQQQDQEPESTAFLTQLIFATPELRARYHDKHAQWQDAYVQTLLQHRPSHPDGVLALQVQVSITITAFLTAIRAWADGGAQGPLCPWVKAAFAAMPMGNAPAVTAG